MNLNNQPWVEHYDPGVPAQIDIPQITVIELFKQSVEKYGSAVCTIYNDQMLTYQEVDHQSDQIASLLLQNGIRKGDRVGLLLPNAPGFVVGFLGILKAGGVVMALNPAYRKVELHDLLRESGASALIVSEDCLPSIGNDEGALGLAMLFTLDETSGALIPNLSRGITIENHHRPLRLEDVAISPDDPAIFQYSGGTTGTPKCAVGLHRNLVANVMQFSHWLVNTTPGEETVLVAIPMYHVYGMVLGMALAINLGARMLLMSNPQNLVRLLEDAEKYHASIFPGVPNLYAAINNHPAVLSGAYDLSSIKACISGSATLPETVKQAFEALTHGHLVEGYGLSEAPTATHCNPILGENKTGSIGLPLPNVACRIVDLDKGTEEVDVGQIGELIIRGPQVMSHYHGHPEETESAIRDGWLFTGDVARMDADGYFYLVDRKKDVVKVGGFQVWPNEIEAVIRQHPGVKDVAVAGVTDENGSEVTKAWIILKDEADCSEDEIRLFCDKFLTGYKIPKYIAFRTTLPRTRVGKVLRRELVLEHQAGR